MNTANVCLSPCFYCANKCTKELAMPFIRIKEVRLCIYKKMY